MKLILAIINHDDANTVTQALTKKGFSSTKLATTGGFLMAGNVTILIGVDEEKVHELHPVYAFSTTTVEVRSVGLLTMGTVTLHLSEIYLSLYRHVQ